jgi:hypothetical protein
LSANPLAYWRLGETNDPSSGTLPAFEFWNGFTGTYGPVSQPGVVGPRPLDFAQFESANNAVQTSVNGSAPSWVTLPAIHLNTNTVTITAWIYPNTTHSDYNGLLMTRNGSTEAAGMHYTLDNQIGYTWNGGNQETYSFMSALRPPPLQWSFVSLVINSTNAALYLYNSIDLSSTNNAIPHTSEAWDGTAQLGGDQELPGWRIFDGTIDEVAIFNHAFTPAQVLNLYNSAFNAPAPQPRITNVAQIGSNLVFSGTNGVQGNSYVVLRTTDLSLSPTNWTRIQTNTFGAGGTFTVTDPIPPGSARSYYLLQLQ